MKNKTKLMIVMCVAVAIMAVGYGAFSTVLNITGTASITSEWKIVFSSITQQSKTGGVTIKTQPQVSGTSATFDVGLTNPGDKIVYKITLANQGTLDAIVTDIKASAEDSPAIIFKVEGVNIGDTLTKKTTKDFIVTIEYDPNVTTQPDKLNKTLTVNILTEQKINQSVTPSTPSVNQPLYLSSAILKDNVAYADNVASPYVTSSTGIDFSQISSDTNGKGLYYTSTNTQDNKTTYYFRGDVDNNYVQFGTYKEKICTYNGENVVYIDIDSYEEIYEVPQSLGENLTVCQIDSTYYVGFDIMCQEYGGIDTEEYPTCDKEVTRDMLWRIVRINEDGSVRLVTERSVGYSKFSLDNKDNAYVGYMYGQTGASGDDAYKLTHKNDNPSTIKTYLDEWYISTLNSNSYSISNGAGFCNDRSVAEKRNSWATDDTTLGYGVRNTYYGAYNRVNNEKQPQFACPNENDDLFTVKESLKGNKALDYPVGLLTMDEVAYAGGVYLVESGSMYLVNEDEYFWIMSPIWMRYSSATVGSFNSGYMRGQNVIVENSQSVRPVINLNSTVQLSTELPSGCTELNGTEACPYIIKSN